jgi:hypothetical protein
MVYGAINAKGEKYYTYMKKLFEAIGNRQTEFNWLITDCICYPDNPKTDAMLSKDYCWISGDELTEIIVQEDFQWIWGVLCAFDKSVALEDVLKYDLPRAEDYDGFWSRPVSMQHPLARVEIVPWDSSMTMLFSDDKGIIDSFRAAYPYSEDFEAYLDRLDGERK